MCSCEEGEPCEVFSLTKPKARKDHRCHECRGPILRGELHEKAFFVFEGEPSTVRRCSTCIERAAAFNLAEGCQAFYGTLFEQINECGQEDPAFWSGYRAALKRLRREARLAA